MIVQVRQLMNLNQDEEDMIATLDAIDGSLLRARNQNIIGIIGKSLDRAKLLSSSTQTSSNCMEILSTGLDLMHNELLNNIYSKIIQYILYEQPKHKLSTRIFLLLSSLNSYFEVFNKDLNLLSNKSSLLPDDYDKIQSLRKRLSLNFEQQLFKGFTDRISSVMTTVEKLLSLEQKKNDYLYGPPEYRDNTSSCILVADYLSPHIHTVKETVPKSQISKILTILGSRLTTILLAHLSKFTFSQERALLLSSDMNSYWSLVLSCDSEKVALEFNKFRQMINLFMLPANSLPEFIIEEPIASIDIQMLTTFISKREDFKNAKVSSLLPTLF